MYPINVNDPADKQQGNESAYDSVTDRYGNRSKTKAGESEWQFVDLERETDQNRAPGTIEEKEK